MSLSVIKLGYKVSLSNWNVKDGWLELLFEHTSVQVPMQYHMSRVVGKPVFGISDQVRHIVGCVKPQMMSGGLKFLI